MLLQTSLMIVFAIFFHLPSSMVECRTIKKSSRMVVDDLDDSQRIIFSEVPMNNLVATCLQQIPVKYRERCLSNSFERYAGSVYPQKTRCCTKWLQMSCLEEFTYNTIYCNLHQQEAVHRYFKQVRSLSPDGSPECTDYRPIDEEEKLWSSKLGRVAKCASSVEYEFFSANNQDDDDDDGSEI